MSTDQLHLAPHLHQGCFNVRIGMCSSGKVHRPVTPVVIGLLQRDRVADLPVRSVGRIGRMISHNGKYRIADLLRSRILFGHDQPQCNGMGFESYISAHQQGQGEGGE